MNRFFATLALLLSTTAHAQTPPAQTPPAQTLRDAIELAYGTNPILHGQQAAQRATAEAAVQARAGWKPQLSVSASGGYLREPFDSLDYAAGSADTNDTQAALTVTQPLYTGGRVANAVRAADARTQAGEQGLRLTETELFQSVIGAYMDVLRDATILDIRRADLQTLQRQLADTTARFNLGAGPTRTDVAQADTQQQAAIASLAAAQAQLDASAANYTAVIGADPGLLVMPATLPGLPTSIGDALNRARAQNPALAQSQLLSQASNADIATARSAALPSVGVQASIGAIGPASPFHTGAYQQTATALITVTQPIYMGGLIASQIRQAQDLNEADRNTEQNSERAAIQDVLTAWSAVAAGQASIRANQAQTNAATTALRGYQAEYGYGLRSTLDVLIADQNLRGAQIALAESQHDTIVAEAALLAATGDLKPQTLLEGQGAPPPGPPLGSGDPRPR